MTPGIPQAQKRRIGQNLAGAASNRRKNTRYGFGTPLKYREVKNGQVLSSGYGRTVDISASGILLISSHPLTPNAQVQLVLEWPGVYYGESSARLFVSGVVLRSDGAGAAIRILRHEVKTRANQVPFVTRAVA